MSSSSYYPARSGAVTRQAGRRRHQEIMDKVFGNPLIVKRICFYSLAESTKDLLRLRLVNRLFQVEATKELLERPTKYSIELRNESQSIKKFVGLMKRRQDKLGLRPFFPFSSFTLFSQAWDSGFMQTFSKLSSGQIRRLEFDAYADAEVIEKFVTILSHSPRLVQFKCEVRVRGTGTTWSPLTPEQLVRLPSTFHQLRDLSLGYDEVGVDDGQYPLFDVLIRRAPGLERVRVPVLFTDDLTSNFIPDTRILRLLAETHSRNLPLISFSFDDSIWISPGMPQLSECMELKFRFWDIDMNMENWDFDVGEVATMKRGFLAWLKLQSATLTSLSLMADGPPLTLPPLPSLQKLASGKRTSEAIEALDPSRYPSLHTLYISIGVDDNAGRISTGPMGSVQVLRLLDSSGRFTDPSWKQTFPNLTSLDFSFDGSRDEDAESSIAFILTHFPALVHLSMHLRKNTNLNLWNVLTGAAPPPPRTPNSAHVNTNSVPTFLPEPPTGIYQIPSLGNMRALKTLRLTGIRNQGTLDAILYMTCAGLLGPLYQLSLEIHDHLHLVEGERVDYHRRRLALVHEKVTLCRAGW